MRRVNLIAVFMFAVVSNIFVIHATDGFVRTSGTKLVGRDGHTFVMRGTNCGNWMVREPYMMNTSANLDRQYKFDAMLANICGQEKVEEFDRLWMDNNFSEEDMGFLAQQGFNTLRVPMHYKYFTLPIEKEPVPGEQTWLQEGFDRMKAMSALQRFTFETDVDFEVKLDYRLSEHIAANFALNLKYDTDFSGMGRGGHWQLYQMAGLQLFFNWKSPKA